MDEVCVWANRCGSSCLVFFSKKGSGKYLRPFSTVGVASRIGKSSTSSGRYKRGDRYLYCALSNVLASRPVILELEPWPVLLTHRGFGEDICV